MMKLKYFISRSFEIFLFSSKVVGTCMNRLGEAILTRTKLDVLKLKGTNVQIE